MSSERTVVGLDLGTTKVCAVVAEVGVGGIQIIGIGHSASDGLRRGVVVDVHKTVQSVTQAVRQAELMAGVEIDNVYAGIAGEHIRSFDSQGSIAVGDGDLEITEEDRGRAVDAARTVAIPFDREVLHVLPQEFFVDQRTGIRDPVGMTGVRLESSVHIVTGSATSVQNVCKSVQRTKIEVTDIVLEPLASGRAVLRDEEKEMGACVVDIGGGTTDIAVYLDGSVRRTAVIGVGSQNVTSDIAICLRTSWALAEDLKCQYGTALPHAVGEDETIDLPGVSGQASSTVARGDLAAIIEARMEEIFALVCSEIDRCHLADRLGAGIILTGGGALVDGVVDLAERTCDLPVRLGVPGGFGGGVSDQVVNPSWATALGLALLAADDAAASHSSIKGHALSESRIEVAAGRMREWITTLL